MLHNLLFHISIRDFKAFIDIEIKKKELNEIIALKKKINL